MTQTPNYKLTQWAKTDRIEMEDFNGDNAKVEAALAALAGRLDGRFYLTSFTGNGSNTRTLTFPQRPLIVVIASNEADFMLLFPACRGKGILNYPATGDISAYSCTVQGNSITWLNVCNTSGRSYSVFALLQA